MFKSFLPDSPYPLFPGPLKFFINYIYFLKCISMTFFTTSINTHTQIDENNLLSIESINLSLFENDWVKLNWILSRTVQTHSSHTINNKVLNNSNGSFNSTKSIIIMATIKTEYIEIHYILKWNFLLLLSILNTDGYNVKYNKKFDKSFRKMTIRHILIQIRSSFQYPSLV